MPSATVDLRPFTDVDPSSFEAALVHGADIAIASRALPDSRVEVRQPWYREKMGPTYNVLLRQLVLGAFSDT